MWARVNTYLDENYTKPIDLTGSGSEEMEYHPEEWTTVLYEKVNNNENALLNDLYTRGGEFLENKVTDNTIEFCHRWFGLGSFMEVLDDLDEYYRNLGVSYSCYDFWQEFNIHEHKLVVTPVKYMESDKINPVYFGDDHIHPVSFYKERVH